MLQINTGLPLDPGNIDASIKNCCFPSKSIKIGVAVMLQFVSSFKSFAITPDIEELSLKYVRNGAIPQNHLEDAYHIAIATINEMDCQISWNFRHIVRRKTKEIIHMVNTLNEFKIIEIVTPAELL